MAQHPLGVSFTPRRRAQRGEEAGSVSPVQRAIQVLSLRLPDAVSGRTIAPAPLLQGGATSGTRVNAVLASLLRQGAAAPGVASSPTPQVPALRAPQPPAPRRAPVTPQVAPSPPQVRATPQPQIVAPQPTPAPVAAPQPRRVAPPVPRPVVQQPVTQPVAPRQAQPSPQPVASQAAASQQVTLQPPAPRPRPVVAPPPPPVSSPFAAQQPDLVQALIRRLAALQQAPPQIPSIRFFGRPTPAPVPRAPAPAPVPVRSAPTPPAPPIPAPAPRAPAQISPEVIAAIKAIAERGPSRPVF